MGGNALKNVNTVRVSDEQYNKIKKDVLNKLKDMITCKTVIETPNKTDYGDLDVLYLSKPDINILEIINKIFNPKDYTHSGDVLSFSYQIDDNQYFQIDMIKCKNLEMCDFYYSYGDLGGIIGTLAKHYGLTYGFNGLWINLNEETIKNYVEQYKIKDINEQVYNICQDKIILETDPKSICEELNLDYNKWLNKFNSKEEIFEWICKSNLFDKNIFKILNYANRYRLSKRNMYQEFIEYLNLDETKKSKSQNLQLSYIEKYNKIDELHNIVMKFNNIFKRKQKFNGKKFMKYNVSGKEIGEYITKFTLYIETKYNSEFNIWLDINNEELVDTEINNYVVSNKKN